MKRTYSHRRVVRPPEVSPTEAYARTLEAVVTTDRLPGLRRLGVQSSWPKEFAFHAEAIRWIIFAGKARTDKNFKRLRVDDFADINLDPPREEDAEDRVERKPLTRAAIADAEIAGAWLACLALLPENVEEFKRGAERFRRGKAREVRVDDQRIVEWHARGASLRTIGTNLQGGKLNEHEVENRIREIAGALARIANGRARLIDPRARAGRREYA